LGLLAVLVRLLEQFKHSFHLLLLRVWAFVLLLPVCAFTLLYRAALQASDVAGWEEIAAKSPACCEQAQKSLTSAPRIRYTCFIFECKESDPHTNTALF
jgi:hypothetical protein